MEKTVCINFAFLRPEKEGVGGDLKNPTSHYLGFKKSKLAGAFSPALEAQVFYIPCT